MKKWCDRICVAPCMPHDDITPHGRTAESGGISGVKHTKIRPPFHLLQPFFKWHVHARNLVHSFALKIFILNCLKVRSKLCIFYFVLSSIIHHCDGSIEKMKTLGGFVHQTYQVMVKGSKNATNIRHTLIYLIQSHIHYCTEIWVTHILNCYVKIYCKDESHYIIYFIELGCYGIFYFLFFY